MVVLHFFAPKSSNRKLMAGLIHQNYF